MLGEISCDWSGELNEANTNGSCVGKDKKNLFASQQEKILTVIAL